MIITCPNCQTRYKVAADAIGAVGRQVQCAACTNAWLATPTFPASPNPLADPEPDDDELAFRDDTDALFTEDDEVLLDRAFAQADAGEDPPRDAEAEAEAEAVGEAPAGSGQSGGKSEDTGRPQRHAAALTKRKMDLNRKLPLARLRRAGRWVCALALVGLVSGTIGFRTDIVRAVPELDALYRAVGFGTNVLGLSFSDLNTLRTTRDGNSVLMVTAKISNTTNRVAFVPPVLVSLAGEDGQIRYEWSVNPPARNILPGEVLGIDTQLTNPPADIARVRLTFVEGQNRPADGAREQTSMRRGQEQ